jgi:hypothetical protein
LKLTNDNDIPSLMFASFDACLVALMVAYTLSGMTTDGKVCHFTSASTVRQLLEVLKIWVTKTLK